ncbi:MAG TPA: hypothetical protein VGN12_15040 [Pirellulales bacterium]|jgi:hypothetical protein
MQAFFQAPRGWRAILLPMFVVLITEVSLADAEGDQPAELINDLQLDDLPQALDWRAVFLSEFVDDNLAENPQVVLDDETHRSCAGCSAAQDKINRRIAPPAPHDQSAPSARSGEQSDSRPRTSLAAREILKLRRAVGVNPIAGTMFDQPSRETDAWAEDQSKAAASDERTIAEAIRQFEEEDDAVPSTSAEYKNWPAPETPNPWAAHLLRPAERHLAEAAELLEQAGQYDRADAVRELATQVRQDARKIETKQARPVPLMSPSLYGPGAR